MSIPNWMPIAQSYMGLKEISGKGSNKTIDGWFEEFGYPQFKDDTAWCSLFAMKVMKDAGYTGSNSLAARSWLKWGKSIRNPSYGCIVVFKRGNSTWQGHVAFYVKEDDKYVWTRASCSEPLGSPSHPGFCVHLHSFRGSAPSSPHSRSCGHWQRWLVRCVRRWTTRAPFARSPSAWAMRAPA